MGSEGGGELIVKVSKREVVAAVLSLQEHWLPLSNLDLLLPPVDVGVFFCYKKNTSFLGKDLSNNFGSMVGVLEKALAQALVTYYAFAGEVMPNPVGEPEILCNNRGVDFVEAFAEAELKDLDFYNPDETIEGKLVPKKEHGVLAVQVRHVFLIPNIFTYTPTRTRWYIYAGYRIYKIHTHTHTHTYIAVIFLAPARTKIILAYETSLSHANNSILIANRVFCDELKI